MLSLKGGTSITDGVMLLQEILGEMKYKKQHV
jgi:hypothetical protein